MTKDKNSISKTLGKSLKMKVGNVKDEWKTPSIVIGENAEGMTYIETRCESREQAIEMRDKVKAALAGQYVVLQGFIGFDSVRFRFWQHLTLEKI